MTQENRYWPFPVSDDERNCSKTYERIEFLKVAHEKGFRALQGSCGYYSAESDTHLGGIIRRGRRGKSELILGAHQKRRLSAYVSDFQVAADAVFHWLKGCSVQDIVAEIEDYLVVMGSSKTGYKIYDYSGDWPFPVSEQDRQNPELSNKIEFLEAVAALGFKGVQHKPEFHYSAETDVRSGHISRRIKKAYWEVRLSTKGNRCFSAYVCSFEVGADATRSWLQGNSVQSIVANLKDSFVALGR